MNGLMTLTFADDLKLRWLLAKAYPDHRLNGAIFRTQVESVRVNRLILSKIGYKV